MWEIRQRRFFYMLVIPYRKCQFRQQSNLTVQNCVSTIGKLNLFLGFPGSAAVSFVWRGFPPGIIRLPIPRHCGTVFFRFPNSDGGDSLVELIFQYRDIAGPFPLVGQKFSDRYNPAKSGHIATLSILSVTINL